jgi:Domain of unknown function (DUF4397)
VRLARILRPALAGAALIVTSIGASVVSAPTASAQGSDAKVRIAHFSADAPPIDVYVDTKPKLRNVPFQAMSDYLTLAAGSHTLEIRAAGAPGTAPAAITVSQEFAANKNYTVAAIGPLATIKGSVFEDDLTAPGAGKSRIRVIHATPSAPSVDVAVKGGDILFPKLAFGTASEYTEVPSSSYDIEVREAGKTVALLTKPVTLQEGGVYTVAAVPAANGGPNLRGFIDVAPSSTPTPTASGDATTTVASAATTGASDSAASTPATDAPTTRAAATPDSVPAATEPPATEAPTTAPATAAPTVAPANVDQPTKTVAPSTPGTSVKPVGGVRTGLGGLTNKQGAPTPLAGLVALTAAAVGAGLLRRRRAMR